MLRFVTLEIISGEARFRSTLCSLFALLTVRFGNRNRVFNVDDSLQAFKSFAVKVENDLVVHYLQLDHR